MVPYGMIQYLLSRVLKHDPSGLMGEIRGVYGVPFKGSILRGHVTTLNIDVETT